MGQFYDFKRYPKTAWQRSRKERVKRADEDAKRFQQSWNDNEDIQKVRAFKEQEKLQGLLSWATGKEDSQDAWKNVQFSKNIEEADDFVSMLAGEGGQNRKKIDNSEEDDEEDNFFQAEILNTDNKLVELNEMKDMEWERYELTESDKFLMKSLIKNYTDLTI